MPPSYEGRDTDPPAPSSWLEEAERRAGEFVRSIRRPIEPGEPRRHHYVPEFLLRRFAEGDSIVKVLVESPNDPIFGVVKDFGVMKDLYTTLDDEVGETAAVEHLLGLVDGSAAQPIERLAYGRLFPPSPKDRLDLSLWLASLWVRNPAWRRHQEAMADSLIKTQLSTVRDRDTAAAFLRNEGHAEPESVLIDDVLDTVANLDNFEFVPSQNDLVKLMLDGMLAIAPFLAQRRWCVVKYREPGLVLTDRPIALFDQDPSPVRGIGFANADEVWVPLDRSSSLIMHNYQDIGEVVLRGQDGIDNFNRVLAGHQSKELFCHPDDLGRIQMIDFAGPNPIVQVSGGDWVKATTDGVNTPPKRKKHYRYRVTS